jgi:hypothetical protein
MRSLRGPLKPEKKSVTPIGQRAPRTHEKIESKRSSEFPAVRAPRLSKLELIEQNTRLKSQLAELRGQLNLKEIERERLEREAETLAARRGEETGRPWDLDDD